MWKNASFFLLKKCLILIISPVFHISKKIQVNYAVQSEMKRNSFQKQNKKRIFISYLIRQRFSDYHCKSEITNFALRVTSILHTVPLMLHSPGYSPFHAPFSRLGQTPEGCSTFTFPRIFGTSRATEILMLGNIFII